MKRMKRSDLAEANISQQFCVDNIAELLACCADPKEPVESRIQACDAIALLKPINATAALLEAANSSKVEVATAAIGALSLIGSKKATRSLMSIVRRSPIEAIRGSAICCLGHLCDKRAEELVSRVLSQASSSNTRCYATQALSRLATRDRSFRLLLKSLRDKVPLVRWNVIVALDTLGDLRAIPSLQALCLDDAPVLELPDRETVGAAAKRVLKELQSPDFCRRIVVRLR